MLIFMAPFRMALISILGSLIVCFSLSMPSSLPLSSQVQLASADLSITDLKGQLEKERGRCRQLAVRLTEAENERDVLLNSANSQAGMQGAGGSGHAVSMAVAQEAR